MSRIEGFVAALSLFLLVLFLSLTHTAYDLDYYTDFQEKFRIAEVTGKKTDELTGISRDVIQYLKDGEEQWISPHFNDREVAHMVDVAVLFQWKRIVMAVCALIFLVLLVRNRRLSYRTMNVSMVLFVVLLAGIALFAYMNWDMLFTGFHKVFFSNDLWIMNPKTDLMIQMMPTPFFVGMAKQIAVKTLGGIIGILVLLNLMNRGGNDAIHR